MISEYSTSTAVIYNTENDLVQEHAGLVKRIARHLLSRLPATIRLDDLIQVGMIALLAAARQYDASKGASLTTYAGIRIHGAMLDEVRKSDWVPRSVHKNARNITAAIQDIEHETGHDAKDCEVAKRLNITLNDYHSRLLDSANSQLFAIEDINGADDLLSEGFSTEIPGPYDGLQNAEFNAALASAIKQLPEREQTVFTCYYEKELGLKEIGKMLGVTESRVSQINHNAIMKLRTLLAGWNN